MFRILDGYRPRVVERRRSIFEINTVLAQINARFLSVPFKLDRHRLRLAAGRWNARRVRHARPADRELSCQQGPDTWVSWMGSGLVRGRLAVATRLRGRVSWTGAL